MKDYYVYILSNQRKGTLYIGMTSNLEQRMEQHRAGSFDGFTKKYGIHMLVYFEGTHDVEAALLREKQLKKWNRSWKIELIEQENPNWRDLYHLTDRFPFSRE